LLIRIDNEKVSTHKSILGFKKCPEEISFKTGTEFEYRDRAILEGVEESLGESNVQVHIGMHNPGWREIATEVSE
jgi:hypothetical protein